MLLVVTLDGQVVEQVSPFLDARVQVADPYQLRANDNLCQRGSDVNGVGFLLTHEEAGSLLSSNPQNAVVVLPFLNGDDVNTHAQQAPSRWVINFGEGTLEQASEFPELLGILRERVLPERSRNRDRRRREFWWRLDRPKTKLYEAIGQLDAALVCSMVSKYLALSLAPVDIVFSHELNVFVFDSYAAFAVLQSSLHDSWVRNYGSTLETRMRYTPSACFATFPFPCSMPQSVSGLTPLEEAGCKCYEHRRHVMRASQEGLTKTYNRIHDPDEASADIQKLRDLHVEMDKAVAAAYGWTDLDLGHGFHETKQGLRFTISEVARREVLTRLLRLNHERYEEEVRQGLHDKKKGKGGGRKRQDSETETPDLFEEADQ